MATRTLVKLNRIPDRFTADLLPIKGIAKLELVHKRKAAFAESALAFVDRYVPPLRLAGRGFAFEHRLDDAAEVPVFRLFDREMKLRLTVEPGTLGEDQLVQALLDADRKLQLPQ